MSKRRTVVVAVAVAAAAALLISSPWASGSSRKTQAKPVVRGYAALVVSPVQVTGSVDVATLNLPKGKYLLTAKVQLDGGSTGLNIVTCGLVAAFAFQDNSTAVLDSAGVNTVSVPLAGAVDLGSAGPVTVQCQPLQGSANASSISLMAVKLTSLVENVTL